MSPIKITVFICAQCHNEAQVKMTEGCIASVRDMAADVVTQIVLLDDASPIGELVKIGADEVVRAPGPIGAVRLRASAFEGAEMPYILSLDNDTLWLTKDWARKMLNWLNSTPEAGIIAPMIEGTTSCPQQYLPAEGETYGFAHRWYPQLATCSDFLPACCWFFRRELIWEVGNLDTDFVHKGYDADFCRRVVEAKRKLFVAQDLALYHSGGGTVQKNSPAAKFFRADGQARFIEKHLMSAGGKDG